MKLRLDLHVHTVGSSDAHTRLDELVPGIRRNGLDGLAITDHNALARETPPGAIIIPGIEISSHEGHIIGLGVSAPIHRDLPADETIRQIRNQGGVSIIAHPYDLFRSAVHPESLTETPDAIEVVNSASILHSITWKRAKTFATRRNLPQTGGSDSHIPQTIGKAFTVIESESDTVASILNAIKKGSVVAHGRPYHLTDRLHKFYWR